MLTMLREFMESSSGLAPIRQGLGLGSVTSILSGIAVLLGAKGGQASECPPSSSYCYWSSVCSTSYWNGSKQVTSSGGWRTCTNSYQRVQRQADGVVVEVSCKPPIAPSCYCGTSSHCP